VKRKLVSTVGIFMCAAALPWSAQPNALEKKASSAAPAATRSVTKAALPRLGAGIDVARAGISPDVLQLALGAVNCATALGDIKAPPTLTVIDYSRPSVDPRLWVFDLRTDHLLFRELVAHGRNTGENIAKNFSDAMNSRQSSIGLFVTGDPYIGQNGYSLRLDGLEPGFNGNARERAIVMHGAPYVDAALATTQGRIGRSWGCPALREAVARQVIDTVRDGSVIFSYYPDSNWLKGSRFLNGCTRTVA
jgi:L,D-transpeptidase-like protein